MTRLMRAEARWVGIAVFSCLASTAASETVRIRGSELAFAQLSSLRERLVQSSPGISIDWTGYGSRTAVPALLEGTGDFAVMARELDDAERELLERFSIEVAEHVLGLDALAVVVHPSNPVESLGLFQLRSIFSGGVVGWHGVGGPDVPIRLVMDHPGSDDVRALERLLFDSERITPASELRETPADVVQSVASEPSALGVVSMTVDRSAVRTIPLHVDDGGPAILPSSTARLRAMSMDSPAPTSRTASCCSWSSSPRSKSGTSSGS